MKLAKALAALLFTSAITMCILLLPLMAGATESTTEPTGTTAAITTEATSAPTTEPAQPTVPTEPTVPTVPTVPTDPTAPTVPTESTVPTEPTAPTVPTDPSVPAPTVCPHRFGAWQSVDGTTHKRTCLDCQYIENDYHIWNDGAVTKQPDCVQEGETTYTCMVCGATKIHPIDKLLTHTYDNDCDTDCNVEHCPMVRPVTHNYKDYWSMDKNNHWYHCITCGHITQEAAHTPGPAATETKAQICTVCGYVITPALGHTHSYATNLSYDGTNHYYTCTGCSSRRGVEKHRFDNACDTVCDTCGFIRNVSHTYSQQWYHDSNTHYHACTVCGDRQDLAVHTPGAAATETTDQVCAVCSYVLIPALGHTHDFGSTWIQDDTHHWNACTCGQTVNKEEHKWTGSLCSVCGAENPAVTDPSIRPSIPAGPSPADPSGDDSLPLWIPIVLLIALVASLIGYVIFHKGF